MANILPNQPVNTTTPTPTAQTVNGQQYVATATPGQGGSQYSPGNVVKSLDSQLGYTPTQSSTGTVQNINNQFSQQQLPGATDTTLTSLDQILGSGSSYMNNATRRGQETAGSRGLMNSSIASGAAQRSNVEAAMPILDQSMRLNSQREGQDHQLLTQSRDQAFSLDSNREREGYATSRNNMNQAMGLQSQREGQAWQSQESQLARTQDVNNQLLASQLRSGERVEEAQLQDWLNNENFTRDLNGKLTTMGIQNSMDLNNAVYDMALQDPELYTPDVVSGMTNFFNKDLQTILQQYFPNGG